MPYRRRAQTRKVRTTASRTAALTKPQSHPCISKLTRKSATIPGSVWSTVRLSGTPNFCRVKAALPASWRAAVQVQLIEDAQLGQQELVQRRPDAGFGPVPQAPP